MMGLTCSSDGRQEIHTEFWLGNLMECSHHEDLGY
jgi:hypothetical protein